MRIELQPNRVIVNDRLYERPIFGAVAFPGDDSPQGYVCMIGALARPTEAEAKGYVEVPDLEPFRQLKKNNGEQRWQYSDDVIRFHRFQACSTSSFDSPSATPRTAPFLQT